MIFTFSKTSQQTLKPVPTIQIFSRKTSLGSMFDLTQSKPCSRCPKDSRRIPYVSKK